MIRALFIGILLLTLALPQTAEAAPSSLVRAVQARAKVAYRGEQIVTTWLGNTVDVALVRVQHDPPSKTQLEYMPVGSSRRLTVFLQDGVEIRYNPVTRKGTRSARVAFEDQLDEIFLTTHLPLLLSNYRISISSGRLLGREVERVELTPLVHDRPTRRIAVDRETGVILRSERINPDGRLAQVTAFLSFEVMPKGWLKDTHLPPNLHLREVPPSRSVSLAEAARQLGRTPVRVIPPEGFQTIATYLTQDPQPVLEAVYSDGLSVLLVTYQPGRLPKPPRGSRIVHTKTGPLWVLPMGLRNLVHWSYEGWLLTMVGDVSTDGLMLAAQRTGVSSAPSILVRILPWLRGLSLPSFQAFLTFPLLMEKAPSRRRSVVR